MHYARYGMPNASDATQIMNRTSASRASRVEFGATCATCHALARILTCMHASQITNFNENISENIFKKFDQNFDDNTVYMYVDNV